MKILNIIVILLFSFVCKNANGKNIIVKKTIPVGKNREIKTIQSGVSIANDGDTVLVDAGLYKEGGIVIEKSIVLKGINHPVIDGEYKHEILFIRGKEITVDGFKLQHTGRSEIKDIG
ncbi:MAG TPA: hypothetical protein VLI68_04995, partial [Hanamia sp.]|nr:hypothetical protein [Hanamia sp.]